MNLINRFKSKKAYLTDMFLGKYFPKKLADKVYKQRVGTTKGINWDNPKDLNEKINWLKFYSNTKEWSRLADKYAVRDFIKERGWEDILVQLYGVWDNAKQIDFASLPNSFVLKTNNGSGTVWIVKDKQHEDLEKLRKQVDEALKQTFGIIYGEPHYSRIKPKVIAEEFLIETNPVSSSLVDYKMWCFDGEYFGSWTCYNRHGFVAKTEWHDAAWNYHPEWSVFNEHYQDGEGKLAKPVNYEKMIEIAKSLSKGFPQVRVDLYNINGKVYFGEMTFTSMGGYMDCYSQEALDTMGAMIKLKKK